MPRVDLRVRAARTIAVDLATAEAVRGMGAAGVRCILLKGPALASLMNEDGVLRTYVDVDLLVAPADEEPAGAVLRGLGFEQLVGDSELGGHRRLHAHEWRRADGPSVDLHRTLPGARADPAVVVSVLATRTSAISVAGEEVEALAPAGLALQVALHAAHHGPLASKALADLDRAVERIPFADWVEAASSPSASTPRPRSPPACGCDPRELRSPTGCRSRARCRSTSPSRPAAPRRSQSGSTGCCRRPARGRSSPSSRGRRCLLRGRSGSGVRSRGGGLAGSPPPTCRTRSG